MTGDTVLIPSTGLANPFPDSTSTRRLWPVAAKPDPLLIGLTGLAGTGKDTVADRLCAEHGFERHAFAEPIRDMLTAMLAGANIDYAHLFERDLKERPVPHLGISGRRLMQTLGTEWGRALDPDLWVRLAAITLGLHGACSAPIHDRIVITDVRFPNEAAWIEGLGGRVVRVTRPAPEVAAHVSEQHIAQLPCTLAIDNTGTLADLHEQVDNLARLLLL